MKTAKEYSDTAKREVSVDVDALLAAINEISESEVHRSQNDSEHVSVDGREYHTWRELADAFELDIHDFSVSEVNLPLFFHQTLLLADTAQSGHS